MKIAIVGKGNVGSALGTGLKRAGHEIRFGHRDPNESVLAATKWGEIVMLAVPFNAVRSTVQEIGSSADGKVLVDVTNALGPNMELAVGFTTSGAEELQKMLPKARVVKAFNTVFAQNQSTGKLGQDSLTAFIAGDDSNAKQVVMQLAQDIGFEPVDVGPLKSARYLEPMAVLMIGLGYGMKMGTKMGLKLLRI
jgi:predicted dinucleotide-binding enzyme